MRWLSRLQEKPKAYRQQVAFMGAVGLTSIIVLFWLVSLPQRYSLERVASEPLVPDATEDAQSFFEGVREQIANVRSAFSELEQGEEPTAVDTVVATSTSPTTTAPSLATTTTSATTP
jgi:hypothetical protein